MAKSPSTGGVPLHTWVDPSIRAELAAAAERNERSLSGEMRVALTEHVRNEQPAETAEGEQ
jgi:hypothetical protein